METESSNGSLMDMSVGPQHHFDISPLQGEDGEISHITRTVSAKAIVENTNPAHAPSNLLSLDVLRRQRDCKREEARALTEKIMQEEKSIQTEIARINQKEKEDESKFSLGQQELDRQITEIKRR